MSYEGYNQCICKNGHYFESQENYGSGDYTCNICNAEAAFVNAVNTTNCDDVGYISPEDFKKHFLIKEAVIEVCNLGHSHVTSHAIYRIPSVEEAKPLQQFWDCETATLKYLPEV